MRHGTANDRNPSGDPSRWEIDAKLVVGGDDLRWAMSPRHGLRVRVRASASRFFDPGSCELCKSYFGGISLLSFTMLKICFWLHCPRAMSGSGKTPCYYYHCETPITKDFTLCLSLFSISRPVEFTLWCARNFIHMLRR